MALGNNLKIIIPSSLLETIETGILVMTSHQSMKNPSLIHASIKN